MSNMFFGANLSPEQMEKVKTLQASLGDMNNILSALDKNIKSKDVRIIAKSLGKIVNGKPRNYTREEAIEVANLLAEHENFGALYSNEERLSSFLKAQNELSTDAFAQELNAAAGVVIAKQLIEEAVCRRIFPIDEVTSGSTKKYNLKENERAVWIGRYGKGFNTLVKVSQYFVHPELQECSKELDLSDVLDADFDMINDKMAELGKEIVRAEDINMIELLFKATSKNRASTDTNAIYPFGTGVAPAAALFEENCYYLPNATEPTVEDLMLVASKLQQKGYKAGAMLINPYLLAILLSQQAVLYATNFGSNEVQRTGTVSLLAGIVPVMSALMPSNRIYLFDSANSGAIVQREAIYPETYKEKRTIEICAFSRTACVVKNINAVHAIQTYSL